jgi:FKBP-type peptidyl-prolyl cis-trans isomerase FkpA
MRILTVLVPALALAACSPPTGSTTSAPQASANAPAVNLTTDQDKTLYTLGLALGQQIQMFDLTAEELVLVSAGLRDSVLQVEPKVEIEVYGPRLNMLARERAAAAAMAEKQASDAWVAQQAALPGAERSASGVVLIPITEGTGANPTADSVVRVHYHGTLRDGSVFDSSVERGEPIAFPLSGVIPCWTEGVQKIKVGGKAKLVCPSDTAYGDQGSGSIPGGAALAFEVELLAIEE